MSKYQKFNILSSKKSCSSPTVEDAVSNFLISKKAMNCTPKTVDSYTNILKPFSTFCKLQGVKKLAEVDNFFVDSYLAEMSSRGHKVRVLNAYGSSNGQLPDYIKQKNWSSPNPFVTGFTIRLCENGGCSFNHSMSLGTVSFQTSIRNIPAQ